MTFLFIAILSGVGSCWRDEMSRISFFQIRISCFGKPQWHSFALAPFCISSMRWFEIQVVCVESEDAKYSTGLRQVAAYDFLKIGNATESPFFKIRAGKKVQVNEYFNRSDYSVRAENLAHRSNNVLVVRIGFITCQRHLLH